MNEANPNISVCWIEAPTENGYSELPRESFPSEQPEKTETAQQIILTHKGYLAPDLAKKVNGPEDDGSEEEDAAGPKGAAATSGPATTGASTAKTEQAATGKTPSGTKKGNTPASAERNRYFDVIDELGLKDLGVNDHRDMVAKIMGMADFGKVDPASVKSFNDVDDKAVAWFTDWLLSQKEAIVAGPSHPKFDKLPAKIRTLVEAKFNQGQKPAGTPPVEDADPFEGE